MHLARDFPNDFREKYLRNNLHQFFLEAEKRHIFVRDTQPFRRPNGRRHGSFIRRSPHLLGSDDINLPKPCFNFHHVSVPSTIPAPTMMPYKNSPVDGITSSSRRQESFYAISAPSGRNRSASATMDGSKRSASCRNWPRHPAYGSETAMLKGQRNQTGFAIGTNCTL